MFEIALILGIFIGIIRGGSLSRLANIDFPFYYLAIVALIIQTAIGFASNNWPNPSLYFSILLITYILLISSLWFSRQNEFLYLILIGFVLNFFVIAINGGMPVSFGAAKALGANIDIYKEFILSDYKHVVLTEVTKFRFLADIIPLPLGPFAAIYSVGDVFISIGIMLFMQKSLTYKGKHKPSSQSKEIIPQNI